MPTDGWESAIGTTRDFIFAHNALGPDSPLRACDELLAVEGQDATDWIGRAYRGELRRPARWQMGQTVRYTVRRDAETLTVDVPLGACNAPAGAGDAWRWLGLIVAPDLILGAFVFASLDSDRDTIRDRALMTAG